MAYEFGESPHGVLVLNSHARSPFKTSPSFSVIIHQLVVFAKVVVSFWLVEMMCPASCGVVLYTPHRWLLTSCDLVGEENGVAPVDLLMFVW